MSAVYFSCHFDHLMTLDRYVLADLKSKSFNFICIFKWKKKLRNGKKNN